MAKANFSFLTKKKMFFKKGIKLHSCVQFWTSNVDDSTNNNKYLL